MEHGSPLFFRFQIDEILSIEKAGSVGPVVRSTHLAGCGSDLRERSQDYASLIGQAKPFGGSGAWRECAAHPDGAFIQMRKEFGADSAAQQVSSAKSQHRRRDGGPAPANRDIPRSNRRLWSANP